MHKFKISAQRQARYKLKKPKQFVHLTCFHFQFLFMPVAMFQHYDGGNSKALSLSSRKTAEISLHSCIVLISKQI